MSEEFDGRFNENLLGLTQDAFSRLGLQLFDPTGEPVNCLQNLVKESLKPTNVASKDKKQPEPPQPTVSEDCPETKENLTSQLNLQLDQAGDMQYRISNLLAVIESYEKKILSTQPTEVAKMIDGEYAPFAQRAAAIKRKVCENAKAEQTMILQQDQRWLKEQLANPTKKKKSAESKATESLTQRRDREFQLLSSFFKYMVADLTKRKNVSHLELAADLRGIRQALQMLLEQATADQSAATSIVEQGSSADSSKAEQKYSNTRPVTKCDPSEKAKGSEVTDSTAPSTSSRSSLLKTDKQSRSLGGHMVVPATDGCTEIIEIIDDDDDD